MTKSSQPISAEVEMMGEIVFKGLEGGFYAFYADNGKHYMPLNLQEEHKRLGLKVKIRALLKPEVRTIQMHGTPIEIIHLEIVDTNPPSN